MIILPNGKYGFADINDMYYDLFNEMGISINRDNFLYDQDNGNLIAFEDKYLKASIDGRPVYPGKNDMLFEPNKCFAMLKALYGFYIDKCVKDEDGDKTGGYIADFIVDDAAREKQQVVLRSKTRGDIASHFYYNIYLSYIDNIFRIAGYEVDLSNFDEIPERLLLKK